MLFFHLLRIAPQQFQVLREMKRVYMLEDCARVDDKVKEAVSEASEDGFIEKTGGSKVSSSSFRLKDRYLSEVEGQRPPLPQQVMMQTRVKVSHEFKMLKRGSFMTFSSCVQWLRRPWRPWRSPATL